VAHASSFVHDPDLGSPGRYGVDTMSNTSPVQALRNPLRSLQESCASLLDGNRQHAVDRDKTKGMRSASALAPEDDVSTVWQQTTWSDTCLEPQIP